MGMRSGKLDRRVVLRRRVLTPNQFGENVETFVDVARVWAGVVPEKGSEKPAADQTTNEQPTRFEIRFRDDVASTWSIQYRGRVYDIKDVSEIGRREGLLLTTSAREVVPGTSSHAVGQ